MSFLEWLKEQGIELVEGDDSYYEEFRNSLRNLNKDSNDEDDVVVDSIMI